MFALALLSGGLFVLPVAVTVGVFLGVEWHNIFNKDGRRPSSGLFGTPGGGPGGSTITTDIFCQKAYGASFFPDRYICESQSRRPCISQPCSCSCSCVLRRVDLPRVH